MFHHIAPSLPPARADRLVKEVLDRWEVLGHVSKGLWNGYHGPRVLLPSLVSSHVNCKSSRLSVNLKLCFLLPHFKYVRCASTDDPVDGVQLALFLIICGHCLLVD